MNVEQVLADLGQVVLLVVAQRVYCPQDAHLGLGEAELLAR